MAPTKKKVLAITLLTLVALAVYVYLTREEEDVFLKYQTDEGGVIHGHDCGMDGMQCCGSEPLCLSGLECCPSPFGGPLNYCAPDCSLGEKDHFCRTDEPQCEPGLVCSDKFCRSCGAKDELCCDKDEACNEGLLCHEGKCGHCGEVGEVCCPAEYGYDCREGKEGVYRIECRANECRKCGSDGSKACAKEPKCLSEQIYNNGVCMRCGEENKPCCNDTAGVDHECKGENIICNKGFCEHE